MILIEHWYLVLFMVYAIGMAFEQDETSGFLMMIYTIILFIVLSVDQPGPDGCIVSLFKLTALPFFIASLLTYVIFAVIIDIALYAGSLFSFEGLFNITEKVLEVILLYQDVNIYAVLIVSVVTFFLIVSSEV